MTTLGWVLVGLGGGLLGGMLWRPPADDRRGFHLLFGALCMLGLGVLLLLFGWQQYQPVGAKRSVGLAPVAGAPLWVLP